MKPEVWDELEPATIPDATATMPTDWLPDDPEMVPDPTASKPEGSLNLTECFLFICNIWVHFACKSARTLPPIILNLI